MRLAMEMRNRRPGASTCVAEFSSESNARTWLTALGMVEASAMVAEVGGPVFVGTLGTLAGCDTGDGYTLRVVSRDVLGPLS